jgi:hypothetical protein
LQEARNAIELGADAIVFTLGGAESDSSGDGAEECEAQRGIKNGAFEIFHRSQFLQKQLRPAF